MDLRYRAWRSAILPIVKRPADGRHSGLEKQPTDAAAIHAHQFKA
jgi:hypothetical protein